MKLSRFVLLAVLTGALALIGCGGTSGDGGGDGGNGTGGSAGSGGTAGSGGGFAITPGLWSSPERGTTVCLFVNQDATKLVADPGCRLAGTSSWAFEFRTNRQIEICQVAYPKAGDDPQEVPIVNNQFAIDTMQNGTAIKFSGTFTSSDTVSGLASSEMGCPADEPWSAASGCCSGCAYCQL